MCTTVISVDPQSDVPVLLVGVRDEFADRAWLPPARHWPEHPELVGGVDLLAGGTWLAVRPDVPRVTELIGYRFVCHTRDLANFPFYFPRAYQAELQLCAAWLQEEDSPVVYDIGANDGFF